MRASFPLGVQNRVLALIRSLKLTKIVGDNYRVPQVCALSLTLPLLEDARSWRSFTVISELWFSSLCKGIVTPIPRVNYNNNSYPLWRGYCVQGISFISSSVLWTP